MNLIKAGLIIGTCLYWMMKVHSNEKNINLLINEQKVLDKKIDCLVNMQWKQDENAIKIYNGMEPDWQGRLYPEVPECEGVL